MTSKKPVLFFLAFALCILSVVSALCEVTAKGTWHGFQYTNAVAGITLTLNDEWIALPDEVLEALQSNPDGLTALETMVASRPDGGAINLFIFEDGAYETEEALADEIAFPYTNNTDIERSDLAEITFSGNLWQSAALNVPEIKSMRIFVRQSEGVLMALVFAAPDEAGLDALYDLFQ